MFKELERIGKKQTMQYKRLGDYIRPVDVRNRDLKVTEPMGINIDKYFMPSVANVIGTDLSAYKLVSKNQFACNLMHVGRDEKIPMAMQTDDNSIIVSPAYFVFEITKTEALLPEYLMMWFRRPEFDRNAWFHTAGDVRGGLDKNELMDMQFPVPEIERQREIVAEYETLTNRIRLNEQMIEKFEAAAQALYRKMFIDNIDRTNLPSGWRMGTLGEEANCLDYKRRPLSEDERSKIKGIYPYYGAMSLVDHINQYIFDGTYLLFSEDGVNVIDENGHPALQYLWGKFWVNNHAHVLQGNDIVSTEYLYTALKEVNVTDLVTGAAQPKINQENMNSIPLIVPPNKEMDIFNQNVGHLFDLFKLKTEENIKLKELQSLLLAKMGK